MKDFFIKHPIIAFLMLEDIGITLTNIVKLIVYGRDDDMAENVTESATKVIKETATGVAEKVKKNKEPIGFKN